jgi:hypothetical protein
MIQIPAQKQMLQRNLDLDPQTSLKKEIVSRTSFRTQMRSGQNVDQFEQRGTRLEIFEQIPYLILLAETHVSPSCEGFLLDIFSELSQTFNPGEIGIEIIRDILEFLVYWKMLSELSNTGMKNYN